MESTKGFELSDGIEPDTELYVELGDGGGQDPDHYTNDPDYQDSFTN